MFSFDKFICVESCCLQEHYIFYQNTRNELTMLYSAHYDSIVLWEYLLFARRSPLPYKNTIFNVSKFPLSQDYEPYFMLVFTTTSTGMCPKRSLREQFQDEIPSSSISVILELCECYCLLQRSQ